jgi:hypothetical protein
VYVYRRPADYAQRARGAQVNFAAQYFGVTFEIDATLATASFQPYSALVQNGATPDARGSNTTRPRGSYVFRKPWNYEARRDKIGRIQRLTTLLASSQTLALTSFQATVSSVAITDPRGSRSVRTTASYVFRKPWPYAQHAARVDVFYIADTSGSVIGNLGEGTFVAYSATVERNQNSITAARGAGTFASYAADVVKGVANIQATRPVATFGTFQATLEVNFGGATFINADAGSMSFTTYAARTEFPLFFSRANGAFAGYQASITSTRAVEFARAQAAFDTRPATITATYGLGLSRTGDVNSKPSGTYIPGTVRGATRKGRARSVTNEWTKRK